VRQANNFAVQPPAMQGGWKQAGCQSSCLAGKQDGRPVMWLSNKLAVQQLCRQAVGQASWLIANVVACQRYYISAG
jgi:hypothetical protein